MKTTTIKKNISALLLIVGIFCTSALWACTANFTTSYGPNGHITFTSTSTYSGIPYYIWNAGDGSGSFYGSNTYSHTYTANGTYTVILDLQVDSGACFAADTQHITITNVTFPCTLSANFTNTQGANGLVNFTSTSTGTYAGTQYYWNAGDGSPTILGTSTYNHTYTYQGTYGVWLYVKDTGTAYCEDSVYLYITQTTADSNECHLRAKFTYTMGLNGHVTFNNTSSCLYTSKLSANWAFGDGNTAYTTNTSYTYTYIANGTYTVNLTANDGDSSSCADTTTHVITVTNVTTPCTLSAAFNVINDTTTGMVNFVSTSTGTYAGTQYYWTPGDGSPAVLAGSSYNYTYTVNGTYTAWLIIENTGSAYCIDSIPETVNVSNVDSLHASFVNTYTTDTVGYYDYSFTSTSTGTNSNTMYAWEPGDSTAGDTGLGMTTYTHVYQYPGVHTVTLSVWFLKYPIIEHNGGGENNKKAVFYQLSTYKMKIDIGTVGIANINAASSNFKLYPNPNNGLFRLAIEGMENNGNAEVQITNLLGEIIYSTTASTSNGILLKDIDLQNVSNGTYFVRVITADKVYNTKTIINR